MPVIEVSVAPEHVGGCVRSPRKWFGWEARPDRIFLQVWSSLCIETRRGMCQPEAELRACWMHVYISLAPSTSGLMLLRNPRSRIHHQIDVWGDLGLMR